MTSDDDISVGGSWSAGDLEDKKWLQESRDRFEKGIAAGNERRAWSKALEAFRHHQSTISLKVLDWWYGEVPKELEVAVDGEALSEFLDFDTGPPSFGKAGEGRKPLNFNEGDAKRIPPGLAVQQNVFLSRPKQCRPVSALDDFAKGVADGPIWDGVTCLAGVRGSGKSTVINRIEWFCQNWIRGRKRPLLLRFDIGMSFDQDRFARDLADQLCREARAYCKEPPFGARLPGVTALNLAFGNAARWCQCNIVWAAILLLLILGLLGAAQLYRAEGRSYTVGKPDPTVNHAALSAYGNRLVTASTDGTLRIWATNTGRLVDSFETPGISFSQIVLSPTGELVAAKLQDGTVRRWSTQKQSEPFPPIQGPVEFLAFSPDGRYFLTVSGTGLGSLWDMKAPKNIPAVPVGNIGTVVSAAFSPNGERIVAVSKDGTARLWDAKSFKDPSTLEINLGPEGFAAFSPNSERILTVSKDGTARLWDAETPKNPSTFAVDLGPEGFAVFSQNSERILTVSENGTARLWDAETLEDPSTLALDLKPVGLAVFSPNGERLVTVSKDGAALLWDAERDAEEGERFSTQLGHKAGVTQAVFSLDGTRIVTAAPDGTARVWRADEGRAVGIPGPAAAKDGIEIPILGERKPKEIHTILFILVTIILFGLAHGARKQVATVGRFLGVAPNLWPVFRQCLVPVLTLVPVGIALSALWAWVGPSGQPAALPRIFGPEVFEFLGLTQWAWFADSLGLSEWRRAFLSPYIVSIAATCLAILCLPGWWEYYVQFQRTTRQIQSQDEPRLIPLPYVGSLLAQILPRSDDHEELDKISMPFLQQRTKTILGLCVEAFGRVVILVDDADVLQTKQFHVLMRVLRPVSKVPGAACVVAVPRFFFDIQKSPRLGDAHSTVRECVFLGDPEIFHWGYDEPFNRKLENRDPLRERLLDLLRSRLRIPLRDDATMEDLKNSRFFTDALVNWDFKGAADDKTKLTKEEEFFLDETEGSKRELLRAIDKRLPVFPLGVNISDAPGLGDDGVEHQRAVRLEGYRQSFEAQENIFHCDARARSEMEKAQAELSLDGAPPPDQPTSLAEKALEIKRYLAWKHNSVDIVEAIDPETKDITLSISEKPAQSRAVYTIPRYEFEKSSTADLTARLRSGSFQSPARTGPKDPGR